ncbi:MAG: tRNA (adenosine(37)-N6)-threonylcarbamoyltransferase complex ATPase subunit type 1 TsaE [Planctomycetaceae bacterium]|nr:tRNA (adenosine(37)-N6)-threonylcarbamoyltransferase complex ATPase subunit type 1 TsaE [Planctomycetaceae bacterium]
MKSVTLIADDLSATDRLGQLLAEHLPPGSVVSLVGTLGAGKTTLVQSVAQHLGIDRSEVSSPTFVLIHEYEGDKPVYHFDAYRLDSAEAFSQLGPDDYFEGDGISFVEWGDKYPSVLPAMYLEIRIEIPAGTDKRFFCVTGCGGYAEVISTLRSIYQSHGI